MKSDKDYPTVFHEILFSNEIPESEKGPWRMRMEGMQFVSAGTDTVSNTMHMMTWHVFNNPAILNKLREELKSVGAPDAPLRKLEPLPYLTGCIYEALRLGHGVSNRSARVAPDRIIKYKDWVIPPGTPVSLTSVLMHTNENVFPNPERFDPERWVDPTERMRLDKFMVAFSKGTRNCLGIK